MLPMNTMLQTYNPKFIYTVKNTNLPHYQALDRSEISMCFSHHIIYSSINEIYLLLFNPVFSHALNARKNEDYFTFF